MALDGTCQVLQLVQCGDDGGTPPLQEEQHHDSEGEVGDPGAGDAAGDAVSSRPAAHRKHQVTHARVQLRIQVEQLGALDRHPVENIERCNYCCTEQHVLRSRCLFWLEASNTRRGRMLHRGEYFIFCIFYQLYYPKM